MASFPSTLCYFTLLLVFFIHLGTLYVEGKEEESHHVIKVQSLLPATICSPSAKESTGSNHTSLKVVHRHGPCSPLSRRQKANLTQILSQDQSRVDWLHRRRYSTASLRDKKPKPITASEIPAHTGSAFSTGNYIVTVGFGSPEKDLSIIFDTGSDVTWIQCQPCVSSCYPQQEPIFDPSQSSSYRNISCSSSYCSQLDASGCSGSTCLYAVQYGDNSYSVGFFGQDTLTLSPADVIPNFRFGCGQKNRGLFGKSAGLLGLGREPVSLVSQTSQKYGGVFSYCLPATSSSTGDLTFGSKPYSNVKYTAMLSDSTMPSFYFLDLVAIIVGGKQLGIPPSVFSNAGTIIDSGTVISRLPPGAYSVLRSTFRQLMSNYPMAPAFSILDTCYDFSGNNTVSIPTIALQFRAGLVVNIDPSGILYVASVSQACLAFAGNSNASDLGILGNVQQRKLDVVYDVTKGVIGFGQGSC